MYKFSAIVEVISFDDKGEVDKVRVKEFELKECPFCGGNPFFLNVETMAKNNIQKGVVMCSPCDVGQVVSKNVDIQVELWNKRISNE